MPPDYLIQGTGNVMRLPPDNIQILLPVWGERYVRDFLDFCLPSLLAPGNIPALSRLAPCTFVLLTPVRDAAAIKQSPLWGLLRRHCEVRIEPLDDLVSESSSTVLTLAYASAIRQAGKRAIDTCFIPLVADYVLSDGSLLKVVERIFAGASGVLTGNFLIEREAAQRGVATGRCVLAQSQGSVGDEQVTQERVGRIVQHREAKPSRERDQGALHRRNGSFICDGRAPRLARRPRWNRAGDLSSPRLRRRLRNRRQC